jgi:hypothetical protein
MKRIIISVIMVVIILLAVQTFGMSAMEVNDEKRIYIYNRSELSNFLKEMGFIGYPVTYFDTTRNSLGTEVRIFNSMKKAVILSCSGYIGELNLPSGSVWLNDESQVLAWKDKNQIYFNNGGVEKPPLSYACTNKASDPAGIYFIKAIKSPANNRTTIGTAIHSIVSPEAPLVKIMEFHGHRIFSKNNKVFIFGDYFDKRDEQSKMYIFERKGQALMQLEEVIIRRPEKSPAPFIMEDLCPWDDEALFVDTHDFFLSRDELYTFNLKTHEMKKIGHLPFSGGYAFYLQCDIIKKVKKEEQKKKK